MTTMRRPVTRRRRGFGLFEMLTTIVILGVLGITFTKLLVSQGRFFTSQHLGRTARANSRASMNVVLSDLRMVQESGGVLAGTSATKLVVEVPYRYGVVCGINAGATVVSLAPVEKMDGAVQPVYGGYRVRNQADGTYGSQVVPDLVASALFQSYKDVTGTAGENFCTVTNGIQTLTVNGVKGSVVELRQTVALTAAQAPTGAGVLLFQNVTYEFKPSQAYGNKLDATKLGLYRTRGTTEEELMAPFQSTARFRFFVMGTDTSLTTLPALTNIKGIEVMLPGLGLSTTSDNRTIKTDASTSVFFQNLRPPT
jgi:prepilin-type N-terminal cleavage/methylation domain-containing protein